MRKTIAFLLVFVMLVASASCADDAGTKSPGNDDSGTDTSEYPAVTWDGSTANGFRAGDGTESSPYEITDASQLALLAARVNEGTEYDGKYFSLLCDIDLNNIEWVPIGNGKYAFKGVFDGNSHTVKNLKITAGISYRKPYPNDIVVNAYVSGLFGTCTDATIQNLNISGARIEVSGLTNIFDISAGVLCGACYSDTETVISNIRISDAMISTDFDQENIADVMKLGGVVGASYSAGQSNSIFKQLQADVKISIENGDARNNAVGGISGYLHTDSSCSVENCCAYLYVSINDEECYLRENSFGAFGATQCSDKPFSILNVFSKVTVDKIYDVFHFYPAYTAYVVMGEASAYPPNAPSEVGYELENVFGYVEQIDEVSSERKISTELYKPKDEGFRQKNCLGCEELPEGHGFDETIWDLSDSSRPVLK